MIRSTPLLLMSPDLSRDVDGPVTVTPSESVEVRDGAWWLIEGTTNIAPNPVFATDTTGYTAQRVTLTRTTDVPELHPTAGRIAFDGTGLSQGVYPTTIADMSAMQGHIIGSVFVLGNMTIRLRLTVFYADGTRVDGPYTEYVLTGGPQRIVSDPIALDPARTVSHAWLFVQQFATEPYVLFASKFQIENNDHATPFTVGTRVGGTLAAPLATAPATLLIRTRVGETITTHRVTLTDGAGEAGGATITHDGATLTIGTIDEVELLGVLAYADALDQKEIARLTALDTWSWAAVAPLGPHLRPPYQSGAFLITPRIHRSTIDNQIGEDITRSIIDAMVDADIDRAGAKARIELASTDPDALPVGTWIAPFLDVVPETGAIQSAQMGLYELGEPRIAVDGVGPGVAENSGEDIIGRLDRAVLSRAETTKGGRNGGVYGANVMDHVRTGITWAMLPIKGPSVIPNGSFETDTGWSLPSFSGWTAHLASHADAYFGKRAFRAENLGNGTSTFAYTSMLDRVAVPAGAERLYVRYWGMVTNLALETRVDLRFYDATGAYLGKMIGDFYRTHHVVSRWQPFLLIGDVPDGAVDFTVFAFVRAPSATTAGIGFIDMVEAGAVVGDAFERTALPDDPRAATTAISHPASTRWLTRLNEQLAAIGMHGLSATNDGRPTTRPQRNPRSDTPARTYTIGRDSRIVGEVVTDRAAGNVCNVVVAIKEDFQTGTPLTAEARNDDPDHPWSTVNRGEIGREVMVTDAVDEDALQAIADAELARASMQERISLEVLPDPTLTVHDVIEITGTEGRAKGRWAIEAISWGLTAADPLVQISARRTITTREAVEALP